MKSRCGLGEAGRAPDYQLGPRLPTRTNSRSSGQTPRPNGIIIPKKSNHFLADVCRGSYLKQLDQAGGHLYFDSHSMMHAKVTLIDDCCAVVGSANMDMRSLLLNYEVGLFIYSKEDIKTIADWFLSLQSQAQEEHLKRTLSSDFIDGLGRILGPML